MYSHVALARLIDDKEEAHDRMHVALRDGETQESLLARFTKGVQRSGILKEAREHRFFVPKPEKMRIAARKAARKAARRAARAAARAARSR